MSQDPYRRPPSNQPSAPQRGGSENEWLSEDDPLAELARLVGHSDDGRGRENNPYASGRQEPNFADIDPPGGWAEQGHGQANEPELFDPDAQDYQEYRYPEEDEVAAPYQGGPQEPARRSGSLMIWSVLGLVVLGTVGVAGYRFFSGSADNGPPPVIKADGKPTKEVPAGADNTPPANKQNYDRATDQARVVEPEEPAERPAGQPRVIQTAPTGQANAGSETGPDGVRRVRTFVVRPDGSVVDSAEAGAPAQNNQTAQPNGQTTLPNTSAAVPGQQQPDAAGQTAPSGDRSRFLEEMAAAAAAQQEQQPEEIRGDTDGPSAGMSFSPGDQFGIMSDQPAAAGQNGAPAANGSVPMPVARPASLASAAAARPAAQPAQQPFQQPQQPVSQPQPAAPAAQATRGGFVVQISSQRTEADARGTFEALQRRFPQILGSYQPSIQPANLGDRGTYYRVRVGPFASRDDATGLCVNLKTAGGDCVVQAN